MTLKKTISIKFLMKLKAIGEINWTNKQLQFFCTRKKPFKKSFIQHSGDNGNELKKLKVDDHSKLIDTVRRKKQ